MLNDILNKLLHRNTQPAPAQPAQPAQPKTDLPSLSQFTQAMLKQNLNDLPQDNLDGTFDNLKPNQGAVFQRAGGWHPPLAVGQSDGSGIPYFDPLATKDRFTDDSYYAVPINPHVMDRYPLRNYLPTIGGQQ